MRVVVARGHGAGAGRRRRRRGAPPGPRSWRSLWRACRLAGTFAYKVALNGSWDENYGANGAPGGSDIPLRAPGGSVTFTYNHSTHVITDDAPRALGAESGAHWLEKRVIAWDLRDHPEARTYRLYAAPDGGMTVTDGQVVGGTPLP